VKRDYKSNIFDISYLLFIYDLPINNRIHPEVMSRRNICATKDKQQLPHNFVIFDDKNKTKKFHQHISVPAVKMNIRVLSRT
jgi:hypothetical protein